MSTVSSRFRRFRAVAVLLLMVCLLGVLSGCGLKQVVPPGKRTEELAPAKANQVVATVRKQIGVHYRYGGSTPRGFDCSGLIWWGYKQHGINVPRVAADQATTGRGVSVSAALPGDILVFRTTSGLHTGLYAGNGVFIHAPSSGKRVREESLKSTYWRPRLTAVRRVYI
ncbi:MAG: C40 family peptidase [Deltaproteobacteria bacterium]|jgi:cell wall-associated NlpC family hydrolase|nr:C40 family peptidase [Deltaproteobacteria bacterium]